MVTTQAQEKEKTYTPEDLWAMAHAEGEERHMELIEGRVVEVSPAGDKHTELGMIIGYFILGHVMQNDLGAVSNSDGGYILAPDTVCAPDVGFIAKARLTPLTGKYYPIAPDLAVEIVSPSDTPRGIRRKVRLYLKAGTRLVWVFYPDERFVDVYKPDDTVATLEKDGLLEGGDVLPGFSMTVNDIYKHLRE